MSKNLPEICPNDGADILMFDLPPPLFNSGLDAHMETWTPYFAWSNKAVEFDFQDVEVTAGSEVALATTIGHCYGHDPNEKTTPLELRLTRNEPLTIYP